ncbi:MFS transporter [Neorhizobium sp. NCHU2750]|uniref:MFS transporter n=1 Tax=Neorhizobium sp. NCHU2750 TaxID=1825976 RepID=UPI000E732CF0|nr:MFS transporter [Neorhizobium sp. NCHU2750]
MARLRRISANILDIFGCHYFRWFLACTFISSMARNGYAVACTWILVADGGSSAVAAFIAIISLTELLVSPIAGWICDRFDRRGVFIAADSIRMLTVALLTVTNVEWAIWLSAIVFAACDRAALTTSQAMIPSLGRHLPSNTSNSICFFSMQAGSLTAAGLVGIFLSMSWETAAFGAISAAFLLSAICMLAVTNVSAVARSATSSPPISLRIERQFIRLGSIFALLYGAGTLVSILAASFVADELSGGALEFGGLESAWSVGSILGAILLIPLAAFARRPSLLIIILAFTAVLFASLRWSGLPASLLIFAGVGTLYNLGRVAIEVTLQATVPHSALGRAKGTFHCAGVALGLALFLVITLSVDRFSPSTVFMLYGALLLTAAIFLAAYRPDGGKAG